MENFLGSNPEILNDETGSNELPKLVTVSNGKNRGYNFVTKISTMFYKGVKSNTVKRDGSLNIRCSHHRTGCQWTGRVLNKSGISADLPEFWLNQENWAMLPKFNAHIHTCAGISKEEICDLQLRNFTKEKLDDGHLSFKSILSVSGLPNKLHDNLFNLIGDKNKYQRVGQRKRKRCTNGDIPEDLNLMKNFCEIQGCSINEEFRYIKTYEYYFVKEFLTFLGDNISLDCTFKPVKNISDIYQVLIISIQFFNEDHDKTHCQPLIACLLPNKKESTYNKAFEEIKEIYHDQTGSILAPRKIHCDNENGLLKSIKKTFPSTPILTCHFHIVTNWRKFLNEHGLKITTPFIEESLKTLKGLLFLNLADDFQYNFSHELIENLIHVAPLMIPNEAQSVNFLSFLNYLKKGYFTKSSTLFLGKISNFFQDNLAEISPILTNNVSECLNSLFQSKFETGHINKTKLVTGIKQFFMTDEMIIEFSKMAKNAQNVKKLILIA